MTDIAIFGNRETGRNINYYNAVEASGARAVAVDFSDIGRSLSSCSALIIPGGQDINPALYGEQNEGLSCDINDELDALEFKALAFAQKIKMPVLGICRGLQIMNVFLGGTLYQDISTADRHRRINDRDQAHDTVAEQGSFVHQVYGTKSLRVNSAHHQAIKDIAGTLRAVQFCSDTTIEAVCHKSLPWYAVQWHPERMCLEHERNDTVDGLKIFLFFVNQAERFKNN